MVIYGQTNNIHCKINNCFINRHIINQIQIQACGIIVLKQLQLLLQLLLIFVKLCLLPMLQFLADLLLRVFLMIHFSFWIKTQKKFKFYRIILHGHLTLNTNSKIFKTILLNYNGLICRMSILLFGWEQLAFLISENFGEESKTLLLWPQAHQ